MQNYYPYEFADGEETILIDLDEVSELTRMNIDEPAPSEISDKPAVVLTRQALHLGNMADVLQTLDFQPIVIETLEYVPVVNEKLIQICKNMDRFTDIVFVSRHAVEIYMALVEEKGMKIPEAVRVMAVSTEVAKQLHKYGIHAVFPNQGNRIDALLRVKQLADLSGRNILIVKGGKELNEPAERMRQRGATVELAEVYSDKMPGDCEAGFHRIIRNNSSIVGVFLHNEESTVNFMQAVRNDLDKFVATTLVAGSERVGMVARKHGWPYEIRWADSPSNKDMMLTFVGNRFGKKSR